MSRTEKPTAIYLKSATASSEAASSNSSSGVDLFELEEETLSRPSGRREAKTSRDVLDHLRDLVASGELGRARRLTEEAARRFPADEEIQKARRVLGAAKATPSSFVQPSTAAEIAWLENPPAEARGKWVALVGSELVGMAKTLTDLMKQIEAKKLPQLPVVQRLAS